MDGATRDREFGMENISGDQNYERGYVPRSPYPILTQNSRRLTVVRETEKRTAKTKR